jgi:hypothetical protein
MTSGQGSLASHILMAGATQPYISMVGDRSLSRGHTCRARASLICIVLFFFTFVGRAVTVV